MEKIKLIIPGEEHEPSIMDYRREFIENGKGSINGCCSLFRFDDYSQWPDLVRKTQKPGNYFLGSLQQLISQ